MRRIVVRQGQAGGWDVHEMGEDEVLHRSDRIRAEGFARRLCAPAGGSVVVVAQTGGVLAEYAVPAAARPRAGRLQRQRFWRREA